MLHVCRTGPVEQVLPRHDDHLFLHDHCRDGCDAPVPARAGADLPLLPTPVAFLLHNLPRAEAAGFHQQVSHLRVAGRDVSDSLLNSCASF